MNKINWTQKVKKLDESIRNELGIKIDETNHILITVQLKASDPIEPAFIIYEDDQFLDLFVLSPHGDGITSTAILKENIQSIGVIGGVSTEKVDSSAVNDENSVVHDFAGIYQ